MRLERFKIQKFSYLRASVRFFPPKPRPLGPWRILAPPGKKLVAPLLRKVIKNLKSGLKTHLEKFKNQKFSQPGEGDTLSPGPIPLGVPRLGLTGLDTAQRPY